MTASFPVLRSVVLDTMDARRLAEFYRRLLGWAYRQGDEPPDAGEPDPRGRDWLMLAHPAGSLAIAFQQVDELPASTWPTADVPQQLHLDLSVPTTEELVAQRDHALALGARLMFDRFDHAEEALYVFADPDGHPFCIFVAPDSPSS